MQEQQTILVLVRVPVLVLGSDLRPPGTLRMQRGEEYDGHLHPPPLLLVFYGSVSPPAGGEREQRPVWRSELCPTTVSHKKSTGSSLEMIKNLIVNK